LAREVVDRLRSENADVLVVDMGWPSEDRQYADVATFGASLLMGRALLNWLALGSRQLR
jgi:beta-N-acetylhexosaminidase